MAGPSFKASGDIKECLRTYRKERLTAIPGRSIIHRDQTTCCYPGLQARAADAWQRKPLPDRYPTKANQPDCEHHAPRDVLSSRQARHCAERDVYVQEPSDEATKRNGSLILFSRDSNHRIVTFAGV